MAEGSERKQAAGDSQKRHKRVGTTVRGKYTIDAFLATGTMANVYSATHRNGSRVALKILHAHLAEDAGLCERFKREGYFANSIGHPGVVRAIDDDVTEDGCPFLVMELLEGETLEERRRRKGGTLPATWVLPVAETLLEILAAAHAREVVHRDLKPDNVFVTKAGEVKVLDFGVARWNDGQASSDMTAMGMVLGTPAYMPPEQALGRREDVDAQSDIWAIGATLFVVLSGESVHEGGDAKAKLIATARTAARPLNEAAPQVPRSVAAVIDRALSFHKSERWPDADAMREALRWARLGLQDRPSQAGPPQSTLVVPAVPLPIDTKRNFDEEETIARIPRDDSSPSNPYPPSSSFLTSAPPITMRTTTSNATTRNVLAVDPAEAMANALSGMASEPIFSLRREKEPTSGSVDIAFSDIAAAVTPQSGLPSTERLNDPLRQARTTTPSPAFSPSLRTAPGIGSLPPVTAPLAAGPPVAERTAVMTSPAQDEPRSIELNMSFTRPMAAMVLPSDWPKARPAAGEPPEDSESAPPPVDFGHAQTAMFGPGNTAPLPEATFGPDPFAAVVAATAMPTETPSGRGLEYPEYSSRPPPEAVITVPAQRFRLHDSPQDTPGPVLASIVRPKGGWFVRLLVPLLVASVFVGGVVFILRIRAARARTAIAQSMQTSQVSTAAPQGPAPLASSSATVASPSALADAPTTTAPAESSSVAANDSPAPPPPKKKKKKKPKPPPPPADSAEPAAASAAPEPTTTAAPPPAMNEPVPDTGGN